MKVDGIGPRQAIKILSGINVESFLATVDSEDVDALIRIPGLGEKTAQKIILALRGKLTLKLIDLRQESTMNF
jgi:Holliday junction DNA helicase RuvA